MATMSAYDVVRTSDAADAEATMRYPQMPTGWCRQSSAVLSVLYPELTYCAGSADSYGVAIAHSWTMTRGRLIVDSTWGWTTRNVRYIGRTGEMPDYPGYHEMRHVVEQALANGQSRANIADCMASQFLAQAADPARRWDAGNAGFGLGRNAA